jgi:hypothetical protein
MFSSGQLIFAALFAVCFIIVIIFSYRKDFKIHKQYYKGSLWILVGFFLFFALLFTIKSLMKE